MLARSHSHAKEEEGCHPIVNYIHSSQVLKFLIWS